MYRFLPRAISCVRKQRARLAGRKGVMNMKRILAAALTAVLMISSASAVTGAPQVSAPSVLLMEKSTGTILYEQDARTKYEPASVTKIMTLLLAFEALDSGLITLDQQITVSAHATSMGGSQIWLKENEQITVDELLKAVAVVSANDCAVALAELIAGSESAFVERMNARAAELGMADTTFHNCTGLPAEGHMTTAHDIALMSRELIFNHPNIRNYTTIWMDTLRNGAFQLSNTNKLIRFYDGATGLKTGSTDGALYCLSATAERNGMELIAVIMHAPTSDDRFESAKALLSFGFANYALLTVQPQQALPPVDVLLGKAEAVQPILAENPTVLLEKAQAGNAQQSISLSESVEAPVEAGQKLGELTVTVDGKTVTSIPLVAAEAVDRLNVADIFLLLWRSLLCAG